VKKRKNNQCSTLQCKSCLKKKRKNTKYNTSLMSSVFLITKESLYPTILYIFYISKNLEKRFFFSIFCSPLPSYFFSDFFSWKMISKMFLERKYPEENILLKFRLFKEFKLIHITLHTFMLYYTSTSIIFLLITCIKSAGKERKHTHVRVEIPESAAVIRPRAHWKRSLNDAKQWFTMTTYPLKNLLHTTTIQPPLSKAIFSKDLYIYYIFRACVVHNITKQWKK